MLSKGISKIKKTLLQQRLSFLLFFFFKPWKETCEEASVVANE